MTVFSKRLRTLREQANFTQEEVANLIHVNKQTISQYELGKRSPDFDKLERLCDLFNVSFDYMLGKSDTTVRLIHEKDLEKNQLLLHKQIPCYEIGSVNSQAELVISPNCFEVIPEKWNGEFGALYEKGDSMSPIIYEDDIVIFRKQADASSGEIVVAIIDDKYVAIRKLIKSETTISLHTFNPAYDPLVFSGKKELKRLRIFGKVVEVRHRF